MACPKVALFARAGAARRCRFTGVNRTSRLRPPTSEFDPKRILRCTALFPDSMLVIQGQGKHSCGITNSGSIHRRR
jgi:hypothetical protein